MGVKSTGINEFDPERLYGVPAVAEMLGVSKKTIYRQLSKGEFPVKPRRVAGRLLRFRRGDVVEYIEKSLG